MHASPMSVCMSQAAKDSPSLPSALCALLVLLMVASFVIQGMQLRDELAVTGAPLGASRLLTVTDIRRDASALFGVVTPAAPLPSAALKLNLLACFVQSEAARSVALIAVQNQRPLRIQVGEEVLAGVRLQQVQARRVLLSYGGQRIALELPHGQSGPLHAVAGGEP